jgi:hypothetical protein
MKISNAGYIAKAIALIMTGLILAFFPKVLTWIFVALGMIIIVSCSLMIVPALFSGDGGSFLSGGVTGVIIGVIVILAPKIIALGLAIFGGLGFIIWGAVQIGKALKSEKGSDKRLFGMIFGIAITVIGVFMMFNPFSAATVARIIIGVTLILLGAYNIYIARAINEHNKGASGNIIDIDGYTVDDDPDRKYLQ